MIVHLIFEPEGKPLVITGVRSAFQKGAFYCVLLEDGKTIRQWPIDHIFESTEVQEPNLRATGQDKD